MVPVYGRDMPTEEEEGGGEEEEEEEEGEEEEGEEGEDEEAGHGKPGKECVTVGWRMPYDLPLVPYREDEKPWCATEACDEPDRMGRVWPGYGH